MIAIERLTYWYPQAEEQVKKPVPRAALRDVNWQVTDGEFVLVAGPSGSGKSTLLRCLNGLTPHFSGGVLTGRVTVGGMDGEGGVDAVAAGPRVLSRLVGFVAQDPDAQAVLDRVEAEIAFALENAAVPPAEMRVRVEEALDLLDLAPLRDRRIHTLSGGERQRLAIAAALALRPRVLVLDEPTSQLDPQSAEDVLRALVRLNEDLGLTIVLAEHRLERIVRYADRLTYLERGRIVVDAPVREALALIPAGPPLVKLARALGWRPLPVTVKEAKPFAQTRIAGVPSAPGSPPPPAGTAASHRSAGVSPALGSPPPAAGTAASQSGPPLLEVDDLRFAYNGQQTLNRVTLAVHPGEAVALVGRNGAGKSTLLKCVVGLLRGQAGEVRVNGRSTRGRDVADICREVGYLPQNPDDLLFAETVAEELRETLRNHRLPEAPVELDGLLERLGLSDFAAVYPRDLSVGQRQRVALGAVTVTRPRLLLLDEPTRGLDMPAKEALAAMWRRWLTEGAALLLVTHDVELAGLVADRTVMLSQGEVIAAGPTREVLGSSPHFAPQIARLFPETGWLTVADALAGLGEE